MVLRLLESRLNKLEKSGSASITAEELATVRDQLKTLKDLDSHPDIKRYAMENLELKGISFVVVVRRDQRLLLV
jgi:hypothetical protein